MKPHCQSTKDLSLSRFSGVKLTEKRRQVLEIVTDATQPLSAYDIAGVYQQRHSTSIPVMSVYRMLNFLVTSGYVHKLESVNRYMACEHLTCEHEHQNVQFLICDQCQQVQEVDIEEQAQRLLFNGVEQSGFQLNTRHLELHGICQNCRET